jgi:flavin-dependent dehydrogenase
LSADFEVVVLGGGPAGLAVAGLLAQRGRTVAVLERNDYRAARVGETFGGEIGPLLDALGAGAAMSAPGDGQVRFDCIRSAWGSDELADHDSMLHPLGAGVHVDRARFDERLAEWARSVGVTVHAGVGRSTIVRAGDQLTVSPHDGPAVRARFLVDASGRGAPAIGSLDGRRWLAADRQVAVIARLSARAGDDAVLLLEAVEDGWWYSVPQPDGGLVVAFVTDADLAPAGARARLAERFGEALARTRHTAARTRGARLDGEPRLVRADSGVLLPAGGRGWRAIGDAAMATDPLAGNGVPRALRSALRAADEIPRALDGDDRAPDLTPVFADYLDRRGTFYLQEARWPAAPFWARRRPVAWREVALTLGPEASLRAAGEPGAEALWPAEALIPPRALRAVLASSSVPRPAHEVLSQLKALAPLGDRRLLVGVQLLVERGVLAAS